jgi:hypothetical protein
MIVSQPARRAEPASKLTAPFSPPTAAGGARFETWRAVRARRWRRAEPASKLGARFVPGDGGGRPASKLGARFVPAMAAGGARLETCRARLETIGLLSYLGTRMLAERGGISSFTRPWLTCASPGAPNWSDSVVPSGKFPAGT